MGVIRIAIVGQGQASQEVVNTFHYDDGGSIVSISDLQAWLNTFETAIIPHYVGMLSSTYHYSECDAVMVAGTSTGISATAFALTGAAGLVAGTPSPIMNCAILKRLTGIAKRYGRGRLFVSPVPETLIDQNGKMNLPMTGAAAFITAAIAVITNGSQSANPCLWDPISHGTTFITAMAVAAYSGQRRSRRGNVGV